MDIREKGKKIEHSHQWDLQKDEKMRVIVLNKFTQNRDLALKLIATGNIRLIEATKCPYWVAGLTLSSREWGKGFFPGQNKLGQIIMQIRDELRPLFQQAAVPKPDTLSPAETLALATSDKADQIPVPTPHVVKQMVTHPPPSFETANRFAPLQTQDSSDVSMSTSDQPSINQKLQAMAAAIQPTLIPSVAESKTNTVAASNTIPADRDKDASIITQSVATSTTSGTPAGTKSPMDVSTTHQDTSRGNHVNDITDFILKSQPGFSPERSNFEVTDSKSSTFRSKLDFVVQKIVK